MAKQEKAFVLKESFEEVSGGSTGVGFGGRTVNWGEAVANGGAFVTDDPEEINALQKVEALKVISVSKADEDYRATYSDSPNAATADDEEEAREQPVDPAVADKERERQEAQEREEAARAQASGKGDGQTVSGAGEGGEETAASQQPAQRPGLPGLGR